MERYIGYSTQEYDPKRFAVMSCSLANAMKNEVKPLYDQRYKLVCHVTISENQKQGSHAVARCVWNLETDTVATVKYESSSVVAVANLYAIYMD